MEKSERIVNIVEDHALVESFLLCLVVAIRNKSLPYPSYVPTLNDGLMSDALQTILEALKERDSSR